MINQRIAEVTINLPELADIPVPKTRAALEAALAAVEARRTAWMDRDRTQDAARDAGNAARLTTLADALEQGEEVIDPSGDLARAQKAAADTQAVLSARIEIERRSLVRLREAVAEEADQWAAIARHDGAQAIRKLTTAHAMATQARTDLFNSLGVSAMLENRGQQQIALAVMSQPNGYTFPLEEALEALRDAVGAAASEQAGYEATAKAAARAAKKTAADS